MVWVTKGHDDVKGRSRFHNPKEFVDNLGWTWNVLEHGVAFDSTETSIHERKAFGISLYVNSWILDNIQQEKARPRRSSGAANEQGHRFVLWEPCFRGIRDQR